MLEPHRLTAILDSWAQRRCRSVPGLHDRLHSPSRCAKCPRQLSLSRLGLTPHRYMAVVRPTSTKLPFGRPKAFSQLHIVLQSLQRGLAFARGLGPNGGSAMAATLILLLCAYVDARSHPIIVLALNALQRTSYARWFCNATPTFTAAT